MLLKFLRRVWTSDDGFAEQSMLDARRARLLAAMASQAANARAQRAEAITRAEDARIVAERERLAATMPPVAAAETGVGDPFVDHAAAETGRWALRARLRRGAARPNGRAKSRAVRESSAR